MIDYRAGEWGFHVFFGWRGSLAPRALTVAIPNAVLTFIVAQLLQDFGPEDFAGGDFILDNDEEAYPSVATFNAAQAVITAFSVVMLFILYNRSRISYSRWWEGGTLLQKTRGEWFNAYSSVMAFTSTKPELQEEVEAYTHLVARLFSLLMCCGLQQVSPQRDRPFQIIELNGIEQDSMHFLNEAPDKVEVILQWIQRSMVIQAQTGVLPVPPPILSRAFQEISRGIVNVQNARKIADFPYPFPLAQISMILQIVHWLVTPLASALAFPKPWAVLLSFVSIFVLWCIHFNALDLEFPFGARANDLPMDEFQEEWNNSLISFLDHRAQRPPLFQFHPERASQLEIVMSDASEQYTPKVFVPKVDKGAAVIRIGAPPTSVGQHEPNRGDGVAHVEQPTVNAAPCVSLRSSGSDIPAARRPSLCSSGSGTPGSRHTNSSKPKRRSIQRRRSAPLESSGTSEPPEVGGPGGPNHWTSEPWTPAKHEGMNLSESADDGMQAGVSQSATLASAEQVHVTIVAEHLSNLE